MFCWECDDKRRTVGDILQQREKLISVDASNEHASKRQRTAKRADPEQAHFMWASDMRDKNDAVTADVLRTKAKRFGTELHITDFYYTNGWLQRP